MDRQTDRQTDRQMGRTNNLLHLEPIHFLVGNYAVTSLGKSIFLEPRLRKMYSVTSPAILGNYVFFYP